MDKCQITGKDFCSMSIDDLKKLNCFNYFSLEKFRIWKTKDE